MLVALQLEAANPEACIGLQDWRFGATVFRGSGLRFMEKGFRSCTRLESTLSRCPSSNKDD